VSNEIRLGRAACAAVLLALSIGGGAAKAADSLYDVAKVSVDTTAKDAVAARTMGMAEAGQRALKIVLQRLVPNSAYAQLPEISGQDAESMVNGVSIRSEQNSTTRYLATLDVSLNEMAVKHFLAMHGLPYSEARAPAISILPLVLEGNSVKSEGEEGWLRAWQDLDLSHSITPANILRPRQALDAETVRKMLAGNTQAYEAMQADYGYAPLVLAVGETGGGKFVTRLAGADGVGPINFGRDDAVQGGSAKQAAREAAAISFGIIENRWKVKQSGEPSAPAETRYEEGAPPRQGGPAGLEVPRNLAAVVEFSGLKDWQDIRGRLTHIAGVQALEVNALSARAASITFDFAGPLDRLQAELNQNGFALDDRDGTFVLRKR
jgi:hypothetical protein